VRRALLWLRLRLADRECWRAMRRRDRERRLREDVAANVARYLAWCDADGSRL
jgi:hypothetical protein